MQAIFEQTEHDSVGVSMYTIWLIYKRSECFKLPTDATVMLLGASKTPLAYPSEIATVALIPCISWLQQV
jgi:hypothetical protein